MTKHKKIILTLALTLILSAVFVCGVCVGAGASGTSQKITATLEPGITVTIDGVPQQFFDANGKRVYPIAYEGSTYLPLRAVCQDVAGFKVGWDQATRTAAIATKSVDGVDLLDTMKAYYLTDGGVDLWVRQTMTSDKQTKEIAGKTLTHWLEAYSCWGNNSTTASFNIEGKYDTVTFRYYSVGDVTLEVLGDNESVLWTKDIKGSQLYQEITVDLLKTNQLTFKFTTEGRRSTVSYIYDAYLK